MSAYKIEYFYDNIKIDKMPEIDDGAFLTIRDVKDNYLSFDIIDPKKYEDKYKFAIVKLKIGFLKQVKINNVWKPSLADVN